MADEGKGPHLCPVLRGRRTWPPRGAWPPWRAWLLHRVLLHRVPLHRVLLHRVLLYRVLLHRVLLHHVLLHRVLLHRVLLHRVLLHRVLLHRVLLHRVLLHRVLLHRVLLHRVPLDRVSTALTPRHWPPVPPLSPLVRWCATGTGRALAAPGPTASEPAAAATTGTATPRIARGTGRSGTPTAAPRLGSVTPAATGTALSVSCSARPLHSYVIFTPHPGRRGVGRAPRAAAVATRGRAGVAARSTPRTAAHVAVFAPWPCRPFRFSQ